MSVLKYLEKHKTIPLILVLLLAIEIFYVSSIKSLPQAPVQGINFAVVYHIIVFFLLTFFLFIVIKGDSKFKTKHLLGVLIIVLIYAISDEIHQLFVPSRSSTINDVLIDLIGILLATLIYPKREIKIKKVNLKNKQTKKIKSSKLLPE
jgi:VanZ family protein